MSPFIHRLQSVDEWGLNKDSQRWCNKHRTTYYTKSGFSLIEIIIAIVLIGLLATMAIPLFRQKSPALVRDKFVTQLNTIMATGWNNALLHHKMHRLMWDLQKKQIRLEIGTDKKNEFKPVQERITTELLIPHTYVIKEFLIHGEDEMHKIAGRKTREVWFYISPQGITQDVIINILDTSDNPKGVEFGIVLNPFNAQFIAYDHFQK